jgi:GNAT superfamily N-acetyltransferase
VTTRRLQIVKLAQRHDLSSFDCGETALNDWLKRFARPNQAAGAAQVYVATRGARVVGYYGLAAGAVDRETAPARVTKGLARHPVPVIVLARLAVDLREQGGALGGALLKDCLVRVLSAADVIGVRALLVHAKSTRARAFYERFDFEPSPVDALTMFLLIKDLRRSAGSTV